VSPPRNWWVAPATRAALVAYGLTLVAACRGDGQTAGRYGLGRPATRAEIAAWDIDVNPAGAGLPPGGGTAVRGAAVFAAKCAACHGRAGEGTETAPALVGREPREGFPFGKTLKYERTVGNYWPYATTLYDYIRRAMPADAPGSLRSDEIYDLVAWILVRNEIIPPDAVMSATTLPRVRMPARDKFVPDDRRGGKEFR
jgi:mono/diheme cytochrome c family protein